MSKYKKTDFIEDIFKEGFYMMGNIKIYIFNEKLALTYCGRIKKSIYWDLQDNDWKQIKKDTLKTALKARKTKLWGAINE